MEKKSSTAGARYAGTLVRVYYVRTCHCQGSSGRPRTGGSRRREKGGRPKAPSAVLTAPVYVIRPVKKRGSLSTKGEESAKRSKGRIAGRHLGGKTQRALKKKTTSPISELYPFPKRAPPSGAGRPGQERVNDGGSPRGQKARPSPLLL